MKPCPFCAGTADLVVAEADIDAHLAVYCIACGTRGPSAAPSSPSSDGVVEAKAAWDGRGEGARRGDAPDEGGA